MIMLSITHVPKVHIWFGFIYILSKNQSDPSDIFYVILIDRLALGGLFADWEGMNNLLRIHAGNYGESSALKGLRYKAQLHGTISNERHLPHRA